MRVRQKPMMKSFRRTREAKRGEEHERYGGKKRQDNTNKPKANAEQSQDKPDDPHGLIREKLFYHGVEDHPAPGSGPNIVSVLHDHADLLEPSQRVG